jgi:hypothetical protein
MELGDADDLLGRRDQFVAGVLDRRSLCIRLNFAHEYVERALTGSSQKELRDRFKADPGLAQVHATWEHELTHWYQLIGTAYGYLTLEADDCTLRHLSAFVESYRKLQPSAKIPYPIFDWVERRWPKRQRSLARHFRAGGNLQTYLSAIGIDPLSHALSILTLRRLVALCEATERSSEFIARQGIWSQAWRVFAGNHQAATWNSAAVEEEISDSVERSAKYMSSAPEWHGEWIGAAAIAEGQAHMIELLKVGQLSTQDELGIVELHVAATNLPEYGLCWTYFSHATADASLSPQDATMTFLSICDVALSTPLHIDFIDLAPRPSWRDIHPGWRFVRLCESVSRTGSIGTASISLDEDLYIAFVERVCADLAWPTPMAMARHYLALPVEAFLGTISQVFFRAACELRLRHPTVFALTVFDDVERVSGLFSDLPRPPLVLDDDGLFLAEYPGWSEHDRAAVTGSMLRTSELHELSDCLVHGPQINPDMRLKWFGGVDDALTSTWGIELADLNCVSQRDG